MENDGGEYNTIRNCVIVIFVVMSIVGLAKAFKKQIVAAIFNLLSKRVHARLLHQKDDLFKGLKIPGSKNMRILEIGAGQGMNFKYYPDGTILTCLEPNRHHEKYLRANFLKINPKTELKEVVCGHAEDLSRFEDGEFDAVVETLVLCSVTSTEAVLQEIKRVLKPGGTFYFLDHDTGHGHGHGHGNGHGHSHGHSHGGHTAHTSSNSSHQDTADIPEGTHGTQVTHRSHTTHESYATHGTHTTSETHTTHQPAHGSHQPTHGSHQPAHGSDDTHEETNSWYIILIKYIIHKLFHDNKVINTSSRSKEIAAAIKQANFAQLEMTPFTMQMPFLPWKSACIYGTATN